MKKALLERGLIICQLAWMRKIMISIEMKVKICKAIMKQEEDMKFLIKFSLLTSHNDFNTPSNTDLANHGACHYLPGLSIYQTLVFIIRGPMLEMEMVVLSFGGKGEDSNQGILKLNLQVWRSNPLD